MWHFLESAKSNIWSKLAMTYYIFLVGFGYLSTCIYLSIVAIVNHNIESLMIVFVWILYFTLLIIPHYYAWETIKAIFPKVKMPGKWIIMFICYIIPFLYPMAALSNLWLTTNKSKKYYKAKHKEKEKKKKAKLKEERKQEKLKKKENKNTG